MPEYMDACDDDGSRMLPRRFIAHVRKPYKCAYCGATFPIGSSCYIESFIDGDRKFQTMRVCSTGAHCIEDK